MFNWFKSKVELKKDTSIMSSFHNKSGLKLDSEITVPSNFELLIFHNGKHFNTLSSGKYKLDKKNFSELIEIQQKRNTKQKHIKAVFHYVNILPQKLKIKFKKQYYTIEFNVTDSLNFASLLLLHTYKVDNDYAIELLHDVFHELLLYCKGNYKQIKSDSLIKFGITINSFLPASNKVSIFSVSNDNSSSTPNSNQTNTLQNDNYQDLENEEKTSQTHTISDINTPATPENNEILNSNTSNQPQNIFPTCPKCNNTSKFNTTYCLRCGHKLQ